MRSVSTSAPDVPIWRNRDYMLLWSGQVVSTFGSAASTVVYPLLILALTDSPGAAGIAGALRALPYLVLSLPVGALIDRWDRKRVMILCDLGRCVATLAIPIALALDALSLWLIYAATLVEGSLFVFFNIAEVAALPRVVPGARSFPTPCGAA
jgi:MFS family permease